MSKRSFIEEFEEAKAEQIEDYARRTPVLGFADVPHTRVLYPTTVYQLSGDSTSGVVGMLMPSGEFLPATPPPPRTQAFWEFDETLRYHPVAKQDPAKPFERCARGDSWTSGEVTWDGSGAGDINLAALMGSDEDILREVVKRRERDTSLTGEWATNGELYRALARGTSMQNGPVPGRIHGWGTEEDFGARRSAA